MNAVFLALLTLASLAMTFSRGPGATFVYLLLPALLLLGQVPAFEIPILPDLDTQNAIAFGTLAGMLIRGRFARFRWNWIDTCIVVVSVTYVTSAFVNGNFWTLVSFGSDEILKWFMPYYMARVAFADAKLRLHGAYVLATVLMIVGTCAVIEWRLWPNLTSRTLQSIGLSGAENAMVLKRWGSFRAQATMAHPIDLGNAALVATAMLLVTAYSSRLSVRNWFVAAGVSAGLLSILCSMSFSTLAGGAAAIGMYLMLRYLRFGQELLLPIILGGLFAMWVMTENLLSYDLSVGKPSRTLGEAAALEDSYWVRALILQRAWPFAESAGLLGHGFESMTRSTLQLESVDNSYLLFVLIRGWLFLAMWIVLVLSVARAAARMLRVASVPALRVPAAASVAAVFGVLVSMYTVWFGFTYAVMWVLMLGTLTSMSQMFTDAQKQPARAQARTMRPASAPARSPALPAHARVRPAP